MPFTCLKAVAACLILLGYTYCCSELNGTSFGVKTILKAILFECSNKSNQKLNGEKNCEPYLAISIKTEPSFHINKLHQFLTLDQIYVANRFCTAKLVAPYIIEISRGEPLLMCPLEYDKSVTAKELGNELETVNSNRYANSRHQEADRRRNSYEGKKRSSYENSGDHRIYKNTKRYSVYNTNLPTPFLVTKVKIFQKRYSTWWKLAPSVTIDSYSGFYANGNLSVWFKYYINIFQQSKSINRFKNYKVVIPTQNNQPEELDNFTKERNGQMFYYPQNVLKENNYLNLFQKPSIVLKRDAQRPDLKTTTFLENCPYNSSILCFNMLDDVVAGYSLKIRLPFIENAFIKANVFKVKIINVITDATVKHTLNVTINLVNEGFEVHEFVVNVDCLERIRINQTYITKRLLPHIGETVNIFLPFIFKNSPKASTKVYCKIQIKSLLQIFTKRNLNQRKYGQTNAQNLQNQRLVTTRKIAVMPYQRCLCVWKCRCHCLAKLETSIDYNICQEIDSLAQSKAGLLINSNYYELNEKDSEDSNYNIRNFVFECFCLAILIGLFMVSLGFCKAIAGICIPSVDKWGYDYLQPGRKYADTSKFRHFFINLFYFILLPFLICCNCFTPSAEDLLVANSESIMTKMYLHVYEVFHDSDPSVIIIEEDTSEDEC